MDIGSDVDIGMNTAASIGIGAVVSVVVGAGVSVVAWVSESGLLLAQVHRVL